LRRLLGASSIFAGWLTLGLGVATALVVSQLLGLDHKEGALPPVAVYGISGGVVLWIFVGAAMLLAVPMAAAMVAPNPRRTLRPIAIGMGLVGIVLLPDPLGVAFGGPLLPGAVMVWLGAELIVSDTSLPGSVMRSETWPEASGQAEPADAATLGRGVVIGTAAPDSATSPADAHAAAPMLDPARPAAPPPATSGPATIQSIAEPAPEKRGSASRRGSRKKGAGPMLVCPWCSTEVPSGTELCPNCHAALEASAAEQVSIPGVTEVAPELRRYAADAIKGKNKPSLLRMMFSDPPVPIAVDAPEPSDAEALRPPSNELKAEMARLDAEIAAGGIAPDSPASAATPAPAATSEPAPAPEAEPAPAPAAEPAPEAEPAPSAAPKPRRRGPRT